MKFLSYIILFFICTHISLSQEMKGKVLDVNNNPVENAYIFNPRSNSHAHSNEIGFFQISEIGVNHSIVIGALGFEKLNYKVGQGDFESILRLTLKEAPLQLGEVIVRPQVNGLTVFSDIDLMVSPVKSSQELLQKVPGLVIGQHAGGGKAEQLFLRGFDIDHGTDIAITVDNMPVNMVSHAHGQGYADLHFVIPETLGQIDFGKGPYYADQGNFATAAYVGFKTKENVQNTVRLELGDFGWNRNLVLLNLMDTPGDKAYLATELTRFDGAFESPQNFSRLNIFGKYTHNISDDSRIAASISHFTSTWDASGQIPQRAVDNGSISRFGAIDDTEGGTTERTNANIEFYKMIDDDTSIKSNVFYSNYNFLLFSNFTFFLEDPVNGDQIKQKESRDIFGFNTKFRKKTALYDNPLTLNFGTGFRMDNIKNNELSRTLNRQTTLENIQLGDVTETNVHGFASAEWELGKWTVLSGLRLDAFKFGYIDKLLETYENQNANKIRVSPKLNILYDFTNDLQFFLKTGMGFHSNDTRVVVPRNGSDILPAAYGTDLGMIWRPTPKLFVNTAAWYLFLEQEFVYVGDAGIVEPSGKSERYGVDLGLRYQLTDWLFLNTDATYTKAKSIEEPSGANFIPLAPDFTCVGGLSISNLGRFSGGLQFRFLDDRPANEDNSIVAEGYFVTDATLNYKINKNLIVSTSVENLFNTDWNETQFATESRLRNEPASIEEIHFTPGTPFFIKGGLSFIF